MNKWLPLTRLIVAVLISITSVIPTVRIADAQPMAPLVARTSTLLASGSCAAPQRDQMAACQNAEAAILASVVRIEFQQQVEPDADGHDSQPVIVIGHGTIMQGRYLVTHNHYSFRLSSADEMRQSGITNFSLYRANGASVLADAPINVLAVMLQDNETVVFDLGEYGGAGLFEALGLPSATFRQGDATSLPKGTEVAQVNWNGSRAHIEWVRVNGAGMIGGVPILTLDSYPAQGASGGGVFLNGHHIANNWSRSAVYNGQTGARLRQYSTAALNSSRVLAAGG